MILVVQEIKTCWTKASRGGPGAVRRNAVPQVMKVPIRQLQGQEVRMVHHKALFQEQACFHAPEEQLIVNSTLHPLSVGCVIIRRSEQSAWAEFRYLGSCGGAPERGWVRKTLKAGPDEWVRVVYNGRFSGGWDAFWWYEKMAVNVGLFTEVSASVFTRAPPVAEFEAMAHLF